MNWPCDFCPSSTAEFIGGAYFCEKCIELFESQLPPSVEDLIEMDSWHD